MIQGHLFRASKGDLSGLFGAAGDVVYVNVLSQQINELLTKSLDDGLSYANHHELIKLNSDIIALTQGLE